MSIHYERVRYKGVVKNQFAMFIESLASRNILDNTIEALKRPMLFCMIQLLGKIKPTVLTV